MKYADRKSRELTAVLAIGLVLLLATVLVFVSQTPRARFNVMQGVSILFILTVAVRQWRHRKSSAHPVDHTRTVRVPWLGLAAALAVWLPSLAVEFISDDFAHLYNARSNSLSQMWTLLVEGQADTFMRPVGFASIFLDHAIWGNWAPGYHATNLLLHAAGVAAFYFLNRALGENRNQAAFISGIYACMPIQVEAVAWMGARFDLLSNALTLWALVLYIRAREGNRLSAYAAPLVLYVLATFSKENGFVLPLLVFAIEFLFFSPRKIWGPAVLCGAGMLSFAYRWYALDGLGGYSSGGTPSAFDVGPKTLEGLLLRGPTQLFTGFNWAQPPDGAVIALGSLTAAVLLLLSFGMEPSAKTWKSTKLGIAWALLSMLPAHFLLMVGATLTNSRVFYMATAGAALILGHLVLALRWPWRREIAAVVLTALMSLGVLHNLRAWLWTSHVSSEMLAAVVRLEPSPPPATEFVFSNMPETLRGVFFFRVALTEGLRLAYGRDDVTARRPEEPSSVSGHQIQLMWTGDPAKPIEKQPAQ